MKAEHIRLKSLYHICYFFREYYQLSYIILLLQIVTAILSYIQDNELVDENNTSIVLCSAELEIALNVCWFHLDQISMYIMPQVFHGGRFTNFLLPVKIYYIDPLVLSSFNGDKSTQFMIQPSCFDLLYRFIKSDKKIFSHFQICNFFLCFLIQERSRLFDSRNIFVANIQNHPLQKIFKVKVFHRKQINGLIFKQLIFSNLVDLCAFNISKIVSYKDCQKLQIPLSLKCKISSMYKNKC